ncbi:MAG: hypothetical protein CL675_08495 [Bdellovibrionaceae bacterium]|nr:hypothetical protein [Pseudobdellovibrionaceae bacterium]|tara:strand:- start:103 stop:561 length:459 start_codon:yes stop_codon:yes gene_type:complete
MRSLLLFLGAFVLGSSLAAAESDYVRELKALSFEELAARWDVDFENDQIWFGGTILSVFDTCVLDSETLRTIHTRDIEAQDDHDGFVVVGHDYLYRPIRGLRPMVDGDGTTDVPYEISLTRSIRIVENDDDFEGDILFTRDYTIPLCKDIQP